MSVQPPQQTQCCIVGGGPGGIILALLLGRLGVQVTLLESHHDFDRDFRGDTVHPSTLELLDRVGLHRELLALPHARVHEMRISTPEATYQVADFRRLRTRYPYIAIIPQSVFLDFLAGHVRSFPNVRILMGAQMTGLLRDGPQITGVEYNYEGKHRQLRAALTVGADGRFSRVRKLAGFELVKTAPPMDVCWLRLPRHAHDQHDFSIMAGAGSFCVLLEREAEWQIGYVIPKGGYQKLRAEGIDSLRRCLADVVPWLADRTPQLHGFDQVTLLSVESGICPRWHRPGLLLIGDAAHVMSPVGGVGISYAIQDAAAASNILAEPLREGRLRPSHLAAVQARREWPARFAQWFQGQIQAQIVGAALGASGNGFQLPLIARLLLQVPYIRDLPARMIAFGPQREYVPTVPHIH
jgi:2-polyprenyl-6-methoxyphenol hydroxylase-like FAD-dependent oxidoreductase